MKTNAKEAPPGQAHAVVCFGFRVGGVEGEEGPDAMRVEAGTKIALSK